MTSNPAALAASRLSLAYREAAETLRSLANLELRRAAYYDADDDRAMAGHGLRLSSACHLAKADRLELLAGLELRQVEMHANLAHLEVAS